MKHLNILCLVLIATTAFPASIVAQGDAPISLPELDLRTVEVVDLPYPATMPRDRVADVDDATLTTEHLLRQLLKTSLNDIAQTLLMIRMVELELRRNNLVVPENEIDEEIDEMVVRLAPGRTLDDVVKSGVYSREYIVRNAKANRGWKMLFWKARNIPEDKRTDDANKFLMQLYRNEVQARYSLAVRGQVPGPPPGAIASLTTLINGKKVSYVVTPVEAMEFLVGAAKPVHIIRALDEAVDGYVVNREMQKRGVVVSDSEVEAWARHMTDKYPPPFNWVTILRLKGTTPDRERLRWRAVQAWKRCNNIEITDEDVQAFRAEHEDYFRQRHVKVSHILCKFVDDMTGLSLGETAEAEAKARAEKIHRLVAEGVDFKELARKFSEDPSNAQTGGALTQPIKKWGGAYDPEFQSAAYELKQGDLSKPVRSSFGYHIIKCDEEKNPGQRPINWEEERYREWLHEEYETKMMKRWIDELRSNSSIEKIGQDKLAELKQIEFPKEGAQD